MQESGGIKKERARGRKDRGEGNETDRQTDRQRGRDKEQGRKQSDSQVGFMAMDARGRKGMMGGDRGSRTEATPAS